MMLDKSTTALSDNKINSISRIVRTVVSTPKLCLATAVCSGVLACLIGKQIALPAMPFYIYSVVSVVLVASLVMWAHIMHSHLKKQPHSVVMSKEERIDSIVNSRTTFSLSARIVNHEISNELMSLSHCAHLLKHRKTESFTREIEDIKRCMDSIPKYLKMLSEQDAASTGLLAVLKVVFPGKHVTVDVEGDIYVNVPMLPLVSFANNIYENALQAYELKFGNAEGFHLDVTLDGTTLVIDDNAGGFDVAAIALGKSGKGPGHGIFLATFLNDTGHLGLHPSIEQIERGTRVKIVFDRVEKKDS